MAEGQKVSLTGNQLAMLAQQEREKLGELNRRINSLQGFRTELRGAKDALEEISKNEKGEKMLINLGAGVLIEAALAENLKALSSISGNVFREKPNKDLVKSLEKKIGAIEKSLESVSNEQGKVVSRLNQLEQIMSAGMQYVRNSKEQQK